MVPGKNVLLIHTSFSNSIETGAISNIGKVGQLTLSRGNTESLQDGGIWQKLEGYSQGSSLQQLPMPQQSLGLPPTAGHPCVVTLLGHLPANNASC